MQFSKQQGSVFSSFGQLIDLRYQEAIVRGESGFRNSSNKRRRSYKMKHMDKQQTEEQRKEQKHKEMQWDKILKIGKNYRYYRSTPSVHT